MAHTLTFDSGVSASVDGISVTSPYTLTKSCRLSFYPKDVNYGLKVNGEAVYEGTQIFDLSDEDIIVASNVPSINQQDAHAVVNYTETVAKKQIDLTTLPGWANLSSGNHTIKIKAKGTGYRDSELSAGVVVSKAASTVTLEAGIYKWKDNVTLTDIDQDIEFTSNNTQYAIIKSSELRAVITYTTSYAAAVYNNGMWSNTAYQTITISTDQQVSQEFYTWFTANANKVYTLEAGTYKWVDEPSRVLNIGIERFPFTSNAESYLGVDLSSRSKIFYKTPEVDLPAYDFDTKEWRDPAYQTITLSTDQTVSTEFYKWAITDGNLVKQAAGETWVLNDSDALTESNQDFTSTNFTSDSQSFVRILRQYDNRPIPPVNSLLYYKSDGTYVTAVYTNDDGIGFWNRQAYRTLTFATPPTGDLLTWLQANGTKQTGYNLTINYSTVPMSTGAAYIKINSDTVSSSNYDYVVQPGTSSTNPTLKNSAGTTLTVPYVVPNVEKVAFMGGLAISVGGSTNNTSPYTLTADTTISPGVYGPTADTPIDEPTI